jgi:hypothetical protein
VLDPAKEQLGTGTVPADPQLDGAAALVADAARAAAGTSVADFIAAREDEAREAVAQAAGADGRLSTADADNLPADMRLAAHGKNRPPFDAGTPVAG